VICQFELREDRKIARPKFGRPLQNQPRVDASVL